VTRALPMQSADQVLWRLGVALPPGETLDYSFYVRDQRLGRIPDPENARWIAAHTMRTPRKGPAGEGKRVLLHSDFARPVLLWRQDEGDFERTRLTDLGPGRFASERRLAAEGLGYPGRPLQFHVVDEASARRDPRAGEYTTPLERLFLQDGELYTYVPAATVGPMRRDYGAVPPTFNSRTLGEEREVRVMLPRGYDEHQDRRYPVLYQFDGELLWDFGTQSWDLDGQRMAALVASGTVHELIQVGLVGVNDLVVRNRDSTPPEDLNWRDGEPGQADRFLRYVVDELKPFVDATYRTRPQREYTLFAGYSAGGLLACYAALEAGDTFGGVAAQSPFLGTAPNFRAQIFEGARPGSRLYIDAGTREGQDPVGTSFGGLTTQLWNHLLGDPPQLVLERDLRIQLGFLHTHSFARGGQRMEAMLAFLIPATKERDSTLWKRGLSPSEGLPVTTGRKAWARSCAHEEEVRHA